MNLDDLRFDERGLIPAIIIDYKSNKLLMVAYMNRESLEISIKEGRTCFYSRSRQELWRKGATSGNYQSIVSITADCDFDTLEIVVNKEGPACHTGNDSCFFNTIYESDYQNDGFSIEALSELINDRRLNGKEGSYTTYLFEKGLDKILKKIGEESTEVIIAAKGEDKAETVYEIADLTYHLLVLMAQSGISVEEVKEELSSRHVIDIKIKQEKMT